MLKKIVLLLLYSAGFTLLSAGDTAAPADLSEPFFISEWQIQPAQKGVSSLVLPAPVQGSEESGYYRFTLTAAVTIPSDRKGRDTYLLTGRMADGHSEYSLNGAVLYRNGLRPPNYRFQGGIEEGILLPEGLIRYGESNAIAITYISESPVLTIRPPSLAEYGDARIRSRLKNFLNVGIYTQFAFLTLFIGLFYFLQYIVKREIIYRASFKTHSHNRYRIIKSVALGS